MKRNHSLFTITTFARISIRRYFRDRLALFFTVAFPIIFLLIFGLLSKGDNKFSFNIGLINQSNTAFAQQFDQQIRNSKTFKIKTTSNDLNAAEQMMSRSEIDATIVLPPGFGAVATGAANPSGTAQILYDENNSAAAQSLTAVLQGTFDSINAKLVREKPPFTVAAKPINQQVLSRFDYTISGLLGFAILGLGVFGPVNYFPELKKQGILRRLHITPLRVWEYFTSSILANAVIGLFSIAVMLAVAASPLFHFKMVGNYFELGAFVILSILCIFGIGLAIGGWAKNERQAAPLGNIISFPLMFLSGTFFPRYAMPEWLQHITNYLPLTPVIDGIRQIATEGKHLTEIGPQLAYIVVWTVIIYIIAFRFFRWE